MIIAFSGVDGSGKSTQIALLRRALEQAGLDVEEFWFRPGYSDLLDTVKGLVRRTRPDALPKAENKEARSRVFGRPWVRWSWIAMALGDTLAHLGLWIRVQSAMGKVVICDRYLFDAMLDLELRFSEFARLAGATRFGLAMLLPRPDLWVFLSVREETMERRLAEKDEPFPDPQDVRHARFFRYQQWAETGEAVGLDGEEPADQVHARIVELLSERMGRKLEPVEWASA